MGNLLVLEMSCPYTGGYQAPQILISTSKAWILSSVTLTIELIDSLFQENIFQIPNLNNHSYVCSPYTLSISSYRILRLEE